MTPSLLLVAENAPAHRRALETILNPLFKGIHHKPGGKAYADVDPKSQDYLQLVAQRDYARACQAKRVAPIPQVKSWQELQTSAFGTACGMAVMNGRITADFGVLRDELLWRSFSVTTSEDLAQVEEEIARGLSLLRPPGYCLKGRFESYCPILGVVPRAKVAKLVKPLIGDDSPGLLVPVGSLPSGEPPHLKDLTALVEYLGLALRYGNEDFRHHCSLPPMELVGDYLQAIRRRLRGLPARYEMAVLDAVRNLTFMARLLVNWAARQGVAEKPAIECYKQLVTRAVRGVALGLEMLVYHGIGVEVPLVPGERWKAVLKKVRTVGTAVSRRVAMTAVQSVKTAEEMRRIFQALEAEGLVQLEPPSQRFAVAVPRDKFMAKLGRRKELATPLATVREFSPTQWYTKERKRLGKR
ncbi:hypothetical protein KBB96_10325 [Luteolibacter ambystomatis]|uniref:Uncharacterized protein n=1 Tax=Luteolibacter ambystomatis TaxID=2824561 RepID=A0A975G547_9BACT|nr:hypothetical protein [Luteolibacter ambystomatis]QUE49269.1 hypothetical protein KBB96_10325 [Luteolibacter ambystomatis]